MKARVPSTSGVSDNWLLIVIAILVVSVVALVLGVTLLFGALELVGRH